MSHGAYQARKVIGDLAVVGPAYFELMIREFGPTLAGILAAVRAGAAISAEVGSMQVNEQVDALQMSAGDPYSDLVMPRVLGGLVALPCLVIGGTMAAVLVSSVVATYVYNADGRAFLDATFIDAGDVSAFVMKSLLYGLFIPLSACSCGLAARGGPGAVGAATTKGVVAACVFVLVIDLGVSGILQLAGI
jgi:phospholipid/cholesterol/gamma-HCH transport system permease protein